MLTKSSSDYESMDNPAPSTASIVRTLLTTSLQSVINFVAQNMVESFNILVLSHAQFVNHQTQANQLAAGGLV